MFRTTVLQKGNDRYTFRQGRGSYDPKEPDVYTVTHERFSYGSKTEFTTKEKGNAIYKGLIAEGFHRFRKYKEVSWYATRENNTPYEETWEVEGIYLIPIKSGSVDWINAE